MIAAAEAAGQIKPGTVLVEPTSGNTGIALAFVCAAKGYRLILTMPESMSLERRKMLLLLGAELELTPAAQGMRGAIAKAEEIVGSLPDAFIPQTVSEPGQPGDPSPHDGRGNLEGHRRRSRRGGQRGRYGWHPYRRRLRSETAQTRPEDDRGSSPRTARCCRGGPPGSHRIQGIGAGFIPDILDTSLIDEIVLIGNDTAVNCARQAARLEGLAVGILVRGGARRRS